MILNTPRSNIKVHHNVLLVYLGSKFHCVCSTRRYFRDIMVVENQKCADWPRNNLKHISVKSALYSLSTYSGSPLIFSIYELPFSRYKAVENLISPNGLGLTLKTKRSKIPCIQHVLTPEAQHVVCFALQVVFEIQDCPKSEIQQIISEWIWTLNSHKHTG